VAVIGKDLNDKVTSGNCVSSPLRGGALIATPSGGASEASIDPASCFADPGSVAALYCAAVRRARLKGRN
jgi:hypothetical protein